MMRGMFAAISGLKTHQVMLDVTANDIANVNTIGYKSSRTTFKDSLTQLQRGASGAAGGNGGANAAQVGLGTQLGSIDNLMQSGALQSTGNPYDVAIQGNGFFRVAASAAVTGTPTPNPAAVEYTRAGNFTTNSAGYLVTQDGYYIQGRTAGGADTLLNIPPGSTNMSIGQNGEVSYVDGTGTRVSAGFISLATFNNTVRPRALRLEPLAAVRELGHADHRHPERAVRLHDVRRDRDVQRGPRPGVHEHDHRAAWLPGQLARHQHRRRDAAGSRQPEALSLSLTEQ